MTPQLSLILQAITLVVAMGISWGVIKTKLENIIQSQDKMLLIVEKLQEGHMRSAIAESNQNIINNKFEESLIHMEDRQDALAEGLKEAEKEIIIIKAKAAGAA